MKRTATDGFPSERLTWAAAALIILAGLVLRVWMAALNGFPSVDGVMYMDQAAQLVRHGRLPFSSFPPGWPFLISLPLVFLNDGSAGSVFLSAKVMNVALGSILPLLGFLMFRRTLKPPLALVGLLILAAVPQVVVAAKGDLSEMSYSCILVAAWLFLTRGRRLGPGLLLGFAYVIRPEALLAGAAGGLDLIRRERRVPWSLGLGMLGPVALYVLFIRIESGCWSLSAKDVFMERAFSAHSGWGLPSLIAGNLIALGPMLTGMIGLPLVILTAWGAVRKPGPWLLFLAPLLPLTLFDFAMAPRYWVPYLPFILLGAGSGARDLTLLVESRLGSRGRVFLLPAVGLIVLAGFALAARDDVIWIRRNPEAFYGLKDAGLWLHDRVDQDTVIASYKPYTSFWAGCRFIKLPDEENADLLVAWARNHGARYIVANVLVARTLAPGLDELLQDPLPDRLADRLTLVNLFMYGIVDHNTAVYRIEDPLQP